jgi:hypothetical protein
MQLIGESAGSPNLTRRGISNGNGEKATLEVELHPDSIEMLEYAQETYGFRSTSKALRVILDYVAADADWEQIFLNQRCLRCGAGKGWEKPT